MKDIEIKIMIDLYNKGVPKTVIAKQLGYCTATILRNLRALSQEQQSDPMIGKKFSYLTVISRAPKREELASRCKRYICKCDCGKEVEVDGNALRTGHTQSCGCLRKKSTPYTDLTGYHFGKLTVLYLTDIKDKKRRKIWHCKCECGNECDVPSHELIGGSKKSCGCLHSWKEIEIKKILDEYNINYKKEYTFSDLRGKRNPLRFDFGILNENDELLFLIEYQGQQHYSKDNDWHTDFLEDSDNRKKAYCKKHNILLYELNDSTDLKNTLKDILNIHGYQL